MSAFEFSDDPEPREPRSSARRPAVTKSPVRAAASGGPSWLTIFTATLAANLIAGLLLLLGIRFYVYWSIQDTVKQMNENRNERQFGK